MTILGSLNDIKQGLTIIYNGEPHKVFMDNQTYDQLTFSRQKLGEQINFLKEGCEVQLITFNDNPINIELSPKMDFKVVSASEGVKGDSAQGRVTKAVEIETGYSVAVPLFIKEGDIIKINTETGEYVQRIS